MMERRPLVAIGRKATDRIRDTYRANRSVDDAVNMGLHFILQHLDRPGTYVRILFVDFSSAFNTIILDTLQNKLTQLSVPTSVCQWITSFLTDRQQLVRLGKLSSSTVTTRTGHPQGCVLSPLLFFLYTNDCTSKCPSDKLIKVADDTTLIGLIQDGDESAYRQEVKELAVWCSLNNLELNTLKTVEMIVDFRRNPPALPPLTIMNSTVTAVESFRFLGTTISQDLKWDNHIESIVEKAQQRLYFLRQLRKFNLPQELLKQFYSAIIESVLCTSITVWFSSATKSDLRRLRRVVRTAERIISTTLPTLQELYLSRVSKRAGKITLDPSHPAHSLFELLPSGRRYRALSTRTARHRNSFFPKQSISRTLDIKHGTHNTIYIIYSSHILIFSFQICTYQTCTNIIAYIIYCVFAILYIAYLYICILFFYYLCLVLLLSFCCTVELLSL